MSKDHPRVWAYGTVDELNAFLGRSLGSVEVASSKALIGRIQNDLFALGAHLASPPSHDGRPRPELPPLPEGRIAEMERGIDDATGRLPALRVFILPGGSAGARELHVCRTVCRRAEREAVRLVTDGGTPEEPALELAVRYLNRLSDLLFVLARLENSEVGVEDIEWSKDV